MACITGPEMAVALAREGGIGFIPQMIPFSERIDMIQRVRRADSAFIKNPLVIQLDKTLREAKSLMMTYGVQSILVIDRGEKFVGIMSNRDWLYEENEDRLVCELMGAAIHGYGKRSVVCGHQETSFDRARDILRMNRVEKLPLIDEHGYLAGLLTAHGLFYEMHHPRSLRDRSGRFFVAGSIGVGRSFGADQLREVEAQCKEGITALLIDTARAYSENMKYALEGVRKEFPELCIIAGNVSTPEGAKFLFENGADCVKVNQGRGSVCRTSAVGVGLAQITAIAKCSVIARRYGGTVIGDGGMKDLNNLAENAENSVENDILDQEPRNPGDFAKAIVAGADTLVTGRLLASTHESAAQVYFNENGLPVKNYEGSASFQAQKKRIEDGTLDAPRRPEGVTETVVVTGAVQDRVEDILHGLRSAMSYVGALTLDELRERGRFELQTNAGWIEGVKENK